MKKLWFFIVIIIMMMSFSSCREIPTPTPPTLLFVKPTATSLLTNSAPIPMAIAHHYPNVDGSTSAYPLEMILACKIFGVPYRWETIGISNLHQVMPDPTHPSAVQLGERIQHTDTHNAYLNLINGQADFILVARTPSADEIKAMTEKDISLRVQTIALDAFVFMVNFENPTEELSLETIRDIYMGKVTHWTNWLPDEITQTTEAVIHPYRRNPNSGSQELMEMLVMKDSPMIELPNMDANLMLMSMTGPINAIAKDPLGIGYSVYYYTTFMFPDKHVKLIGINGVRPTSDSIAKRAYPLTTEVYAVIRESMPPDSSAVLLQNWLLTAEGQAVVKESGYVSLR